MNLLVNANDVKVVDPMSLLANLRAREANLLCFIIISAFASVTVWTNKVELDPFWYNQEYTIFVLARLPENIGQHPLFNPCSFVPALHYLPYALLSNNAFATAMVFIMAAAPWLLAFFALRRLAFDAMPTLFAVVVTFYVGTNYMQDYLIEPHPLMAFRSVNFRMIVFPLFGFFIYFCTTRYWLLAGLALGLVAAAHAKLGAKVLLLTTLIFVTLALCRTILPSNIRWRDIGLVNTGFILTFAFTGWQLVHSSIYFAHLDAPRAAELISPFGYLIKNEPDDWLFLFNSAKLVHGAFLFSGTAILLSILVLRRANSSRLRFVAFVGLTSNAVSLAALIFEVFLEKFGMSFIPPSPMLPVFLLRPWDFLWVAPLTLGMVGSLFLASQPPPKIGNLIAITGLAFCAVGAIYRLTMTPDILSPFDKIEHHDSAVPRYSLLTICSPHEADHERAKASAVQALWNNDLAGLNEALMKMNATFKAANGDKFPKFVSDPEADNLRAMAAFRQHSYSAGFAILLRQHELSLNPSPGIYGWTGDISWGCEAHSVLPSMQFVRVERPWKDFDAATSWIAQNAPLRSRVIHMPSLAPFMSRAKRPSFWEAKIDSHSMYSFPGYYRIGLDRLEKIAGPNSTELTPGFRNGDPGERGRRAFLSLTRSDFDQSARYMDRISTS